jgi:hypothetical protein
MDSYTQDGLESLQDLLFSLTIVLSGNESYLESYNYYTKMPKCAPPQQVRDR